MPDVRAIREMLRDGYGCEDIAVRLNEPVGLIRSMMRGWQESGAIRAILGLPHEEARQRANAPGLIASEKGSGDGSDHSTL